MNSFELNKILGALLGCCLITLALSIGAGAIFAPEAPKKPGYAIAVKAKGSGEEKAKAPSEPIEALLAKASVDKGKSTARQCQACHTLAKGEPNRVGPNLWGIVGDDRGKDRGGFNFSAAMKAKGGKWTFDELNKFLAGPREYIPGTAMTFAGIQNDQQRADVIDYLHTLADSPLPLPKVAQGAPAAAPPAGAPAQGAKPAQAPAQPAKPGATPAAPAAAPAAQPPANPPK